MTAGYWKMPDKTAEDYFEEDGMRYFRTGDVGQWEADGALRIIDRNSYICYVKCNVCCMVSVCGKNV